MKSLRVLCGMAVFWSFAVAGCNSTHTLPKVARAGDTVLLAVGWKKDITRQNITVTITPSSGSPIVLQPNDPLVRGIVHLYPDPVSRLVVGTETQQALGTDANVYGQMINNQITSQDRDWFNTAISLDLPTSLPTGTTTIEVTGPQGSVTIQPDTLEILPGTGSPIGLLETTYTSDPLAAGKILGSLERAAHYTVTFSGTIVPRSIQVELLRTAGIGVPWVVNPRGDLKNLVWADDGGKIKVIVTPTTNETPAQFSYFKFYVTGGVTGLQVSSVKAYDSNGNRIMDVAATIN